MSSVKSSLSRAEKARQTRRRMIRSAHDLIRAQGYSATTMNEIADRAEVAVQTLYYTFQSKAKLLIEVVEVAAAGEDEPVPVPQREWYREMMSSADAQRVLGLMVEHGTAIYERVAHLWPAVADAMSDPAMNEYWTAMTARRRGAQRQQAARLAELGSLRPGLNVDRATDLLFLLGGHAPFRSLVEDAGWTIVEYKAWLFTTLVRQLLDDALDPTAFADLSFANEVEAEPETKDG